MPNRKCDWSRRHRQSVSATVFRFAGMLLLGSVPAAGIAAQGTWQESAAPSQDSIAPQAAQDTGASAGAHPAPGSEIPLIMALLSSEAGSGALSSLSGGRENPKPTLAELETLRMRALGLVTSIDREIERLSRDAASGTTPVERDSWDPVVGTGGVSRQAGWSLGGFLQALAGRFSSLEVRLLSLLALLGILALVWNQKPDRRPRNYQPGESTTDFSGLQIDQAAGIAIAQDDSVTIIDVDDLEETNEPEADPQSDGDEFQESSEQEVDLITQSEVYLAYGRPLQALEVLEEAYATPDCDKYRVADCMIRAYRKVGESPRRNASLRKFIDAINADIDLFSNKEWDALKSAIDALRHDGRSAMIEDVREVAQRSAAAG